MCCRKTLWLLGLLVPPFLFQQATLTKDLGLITLLTDTYGAQFYYSKQDTGKYASSILFEGTDRQDVIKNPIPIRDLQPLEIGSMTSFSSRLIRQEVCFDLNATIKKGETLYQISDYLQSSLVITDDEGLGITSVDIPANECDEISPAVQTKINGGIRMYYNHFPNDELLPYLQSNHLIGKMADMPDDNLLSENTLISVSISVRPVNQQLWSLVLYGFLLSAWFGFLKLARSWFEFFSISKNLTIHRKS